ncbi:MAG: lectin like domain-containing protein [Candidatus Saccharicenans sp.]
MDRKLNLKNKVKSLSHFFDGKNLVVATLIFAALGLESFLQPAAAAEEKPVMAPINKKFLDYQAHQGRALRYTEEGYSLGLIPSLHDLSYLKFRPMAKTALLPTSYDLRSLNKLTPVKNQGSCGACWAFATFGSLESFLMPTQPRDFSEEHLIDNHGFDYGPCDGGDLDMATAYLARWSGPVDEQDDPYIHGQIQAVKHVQEVRMLPPRSGPTDNDLIKQAVMSYGAVYATMYWDSSCYNPTYKTYYNPGNPVGGHAVAIVGWDDNFDAAKFRTSPPGNGAFIVRNSWGVTWGEKGYFYVSYYDAYLGQEEFNGVIEAENSGNYLVNYQYDPLGWVTSFGYPSSPTPDTAWMANIFLATSDLPLRAIGFYTASTSNNYEIYVYKQVTPGQPCSGQLAFTKAGTINSPGYFTVSLDNPVAIDNGEYFSVVLKLQTVGYDYPIPAEGTFPGYSSQAVSNPGMSFISSDGNSWFDFGSYGYDVCLKAFAGPGPLYPPVDGQLIRVINNLIFFKENINRITWSPNPNNTTRIINYRIYRKAANEITYSLLASVSASQYYYDDRGLKNPDRYSYQLTAVDEYLRESDPVTVPSPSSLTGIDLKTKVNRGKISLKYLKN